MNVTDVKRRIQGQVSLTQKGSPSVDDVRAFPQFGTWQPPITIPRENALASIAAWLANEHARQPASDRAWIDCQQRNVASFFDPSDRAIGSPIILSASGRCGIRGNPQSVRDSRPAAPRSHVATCGGDGDVPRSYVLFLASNVHG